jgi:small subunit ribosomal protein S8
MSMTDPISDMLTRIRNATTVRHDRTDVPASKMKLEIAKILKQEGFIRTFKLLEEGPQGLIRIYLKYAEDGEPVIHGLRRVSTCRTASAWRWCPPTVGSSPTSRRGA